MLIALIDRNQYFVKFVELIDESSPSYVESSRRLWLQWARPENDMQESTKVENIHYYNTHHKYQDCPVFQYTYTD